MKLLAFDYQKDYVFRLSFDDNQVVEADLMPLIGKHVAPNELSTVQLDKDWGCLAFKDGMVDIEPKTLYRFALAESNHV
jgi:hypothetical protein